MGMVEAMVNKPQEDSLRALTTTNPSPAMAMMMIRKMANEVTPPLVAFPISVRAIKANDFPSWRIDAVRITMS